MFYEFFFESPKFKMVPTKGARKNKILGGHSARPRYMFLKLANSDMENGFNKFKNAA